MRVELDVRQPIVLPPGEGEKLLSDEVTVTEWCGAARATPHIHRAHADAFYVVEGELEFAGVVAPAGSLGYAPPGVVHWFTAREGRYLNIHAPGTAWMRRLQARRDGRRLADEETDTYDPPDGATTATLIPRDAEEALVNERRTARIKTALPELCVFEFEGAGGFVGPKPHLHRQHVDAFYVLEGDLEFTLDGRRVDAPAGTFVAAPPGVVHTFRNARDDRVRVLNIHAPGMQFDEYLRRQQSGEDSPAFHASFDQYFVD